MDIVFVILHYKTHKDTIECVESIRKKIDTENYHIVAVDNFSSNGSLEILKKEYGNDSDVTLVENNENLGFANGLNAGIDYARKHFDPDFIALINNDTQLVSADFTSVLKSKYNQYKYAVLGPMIITADGLCNVNPIQKHPRDAKSARAAIERYKKIIKLCNMHLYGLYSFLKKFKKKKSASKKTMHLYDLTDCKTHGSFWVLSREYFSRFERLNPKTFLYGEEDILYLSVIKEGLHTLYTPDICIYHKENSATDTALPNSAERARFVSKHCIDSLNIYLELLEL